MPSLIRGSFNLTDLFATNMGALKPVSAILNILQVIIAIALAGVSIWFFIELKSFTELRNRDRYLLDFELHWPQIIPWMYLTVSVIVICVSLCGVYGACVGKKSAILTYLVFLSVVTLAAFAAGSVGLICADNESTDEFITQTVSDAYSQMKVRKDVNSAFGNIERRLRCCGMRGASDYTSVIPESCCDKDEMVSCETSASKRLGCSEVVVPYTRMFVKFTSIGCLFLAFVLFISLIIAVLLALSKRNKTERFKSEGEQEPLKLPL